MRYVFSLFIASLFFAPPASANTQSFAGWLAEFKQEAISKGITPATLDEAFATVEPIPRIIELDRKQPESRLTLDEYLTGAVTDRRIEEGRDYYSEHRALLKEVSQTYGVQPQFIIALWGIETSYGTHTGDFEVVESLATLAYDGRRSAYFRGQLIMALQIIEKERIPPSEFLGSWAGALGQCQFMPESFLRYAVDFNRDGKRDIWNNQADVFASIANYLQSEGWQGDEGWGFPVTAPEGLDKSYFDIKSTRSLQQWQELGVRAQDGRDLPPVGPEHSLVWVGEGASAAPYLVSTNFKVLLKWNRSRFFATAVSTLADEIAR